MSAATAAWMVTVLPEVIRRDGCVWKKKKKK